MSTRLLVRLHVLAAALWNRLRSIGKRNRPEVVNRILVAHHPQMIGDLLLLTPLLAKLHETYPAAEIVLITSPITAPLYQHHPFGVSAIPYVPNRHQTLRYLLRHSHGGFDLAIAPGDNRYGCFALALGARWIIGFKGDKPGYKDWAFDELASYSDTPETWGEMAAALIPGPPPQPYTPADWPGPDCKSFTLPTLPYCVLHVGASTSLKLWPAKRWMHIAEEVSKRGLTIVWSGGPKDKSLVDEIDPEHRYCSTVGNLDLPQLWHLLHNAALLICPDTSAAHLGRLVAVPTVALFGPGSPVICGAGKYWSSSPFRAVTVADFSCRDRRTLFGRHIHWLRRCGRPPAHCATPGACMEAISTDSVLSAVGEIGF